MHALNREPREKPLVKAKDAFATLLQLARRLQFEPHDIRRQLDATGHYVLPFAREFPLSIRLFRYRASAFTRGMTWHEHLEVFLPLDGPVEMQLGGKPVQLCAGDLLVLDHLKPHHVVDHPSLDTRAIVVSFLPEFVYSLGSPSHDFVFLLPFYAQLEERPHLLRRKDAAAPEVHQALAGLLESFFPLKPDPHKAASSSASSPCEARAGSGLRRGDTYKDGPPLPGPLLHPMEEREKLRSLMQPCEPYREAACKARLLAVLLPLARRFQDAEMLRWQFERQRERAERFSKLLDHVQRQSAQKLPLNSAARLCGMSPAQFTRSFKQVAGMSYLAYVTHVRLAEAARLLRVGDKSIAEIADVTGFADQSHFDRRFKRAFGMTPRQFQQRPV